jgi:hypothetical protein
MLGAGQSLDSALLIEGGGCGRSGRGSRWDFLGEYFARDDGEVAERLWLWWRPRLLMWKMRIVGG